MSGVGRVLAPNEYLHYKKVFFVPADFNKGRILIHFGAVDQIAEVYVNGKKAGTHIGGYTPFTVHATEFIKPGEDNTIIVSVKDYSDTKQYSKGKQNSKGAVYGTALKAAFGKPFGWKACLMIT